MDLKDIIKSVIQEGCIEETLSAIEAHFRAHYAKDDVIKATLSQIASDETRHAQLAWNTIQWITEKYAETQTFVKETFRVELGRQQTPSTNEILSSSSTLCTDPDKDDAFQRYGILVINDKDRVRKAGIQNIIEPVYRAGFKYFSSISDKIIKLDIDAI